MAVTMYNDYSSSAVRLKAAHPSGLVTVSNGKPQATRKFILKCKYANEIGLRMIGKYFDEEVSAHQVPWLPASFPQEIGGLGGLHYQMYVTGYTITPFDEACFTGRYNNEGSDTAIYIITDPEEPNQMERYFPIDGVDTPTVEEPDLEPDLTGTCDCNCILTVQYGELPFDFTWECSENLMQHTAITVEKNSGYEMFTLPRRNLRWDGIAGVDGQLKSESNATVIIPKSDIVVTWHNIPTFMLATIENILAGYRGRVNSLAFNFGCTTENPRSGYAPETLLFIDWDEDRSRRTFSFPGMDTTSLKLMFKEKSVIDGASTYGWNHFLRDRGDSTTPAVWHRVKIDSTGVDPVDLYPTTDFTNIMGGP